MENQNVTPDPTPEGGGESSLLGGEAQQQGTEQQTNSETTPSGADQQTQQQAAPESYEQFVIPEDATNVIANEEVMTGFGDLARELNLTQEQAQKVVEFGAKTMHKAIGDGMEAMRAQVEEIKAKWHKEASADPAVTEGLPHALRAMKRFDTDGSVAKLFDETGVGSHKAMIRFMVEVGKAIGEAPLHTQGAGGVGSQEGIKAMADGLYSGKM